MPTSQFVCAINLVTVRTIGTRHAYNMLHQYTPEIEGGIGPLQLIFIRLLSSPILKYCWLRPSHHQCMEELSHENLNTFSCEMEGRWFRGPRVGLSTKQIWKYWQCKDLHSRAVGYIGLERLNGTWLELERINLVPFPNESCLVGTLSAGARPGSGSRVTL